MKVVYGIFAVVGWGWCVVALSFVWWRGRRRRDSGVSPDAKSSEVSP